ncbi:hypothetical protein JCM10212_006448 [Sporobolomyces blumeae]
MATRPDRPGDSGPTRTEPTTISAPVAVVAPHERSSSAQDVDPRRPDCNLTTSEDEGDTTTLREQVEPIRSSGDVEKGLASRAGSESEGNSERDPSWRGRAGGSRGDEKDAKDDQVMIVDWKGPDDPAKPTNWPNPRRMTSTLIVAAFTVLAPLSSSAISPAAGQVGAKLGITADFELSMVTSVFVLAFAIGPLVFGPASELVGRVRVLQAANLLYIIFNLVCAFATTKGQFIAFRFLSGLGGGAPLAIGAGVLSDLWKPEERGKAAALYSLGPLLGPAVGPIFGGWVVERLDQNGYKWIFYSTTIFSALVQGLGLVLLRETYHPVLLEQQARQLRKRLGLAPDSEQVQTVFEAKAGGRKSPREVFARGMGRPFVLFASEPIIQVQAFYMSLLYGIIYIMLVSTTNIFEQLYGQSVGIASTNFVSMGLGFFIASQAGARLLDVLYRRLKRHYGTEGKPEYRLPFQFPAAILMPSGLLLYGWSAEHRLPWICVDVGMAVVSLAIILVFQSTQLYLIDVFPVHAASAVSTLVCLRSLFGFALPLAGPSLFQHLGYGPGCSLLAGIAILISWPMIPILWFYGERIRRRSRYAKKSS